MQAVALHHSVRSQAAAGEAAPPPGRLSGPPDRPTMPPERRSPSVRSGSYSYAPDPPICAFNRAAVLISRTPHIRLLCVPSAGSPGWHPGVVTSGTVRPVFVGREAELERLARAGAPSERVTTTRVAGRPTGVAPTGPGRKLLSGGYRAGPGVASMDRRSDRWSSSRLPCVVQEGSEPGGEKVAVDPVGLG